MMSDEHAHMMEAVLPPTEAKRRVSFIENKIAPQPQMVHVQ